MIHKTKGIILRTVKYGETSIITNVYTELFGVQSYIVKGVRQISKRSQGKENFFQPAAILQMEVYHNELKNLQFIKEYQWSYLYERIFFDVVRNAAAIYIIELLQHGIKQPEANAKLFYLIENTLQELDTANNAIVSNLPLFFLLHFAAELGFKIQGDYSNESCFLDLQEGRFTKEKPVHPHYIQGEPAQLISHIININFYRDLEHIKLTHEKRRQLLYALQTFLALHISDFGEMRSLNVLQEVLG